MRLLSYMLNLFAIFSFFATSFFVDKLAYGDGVFVFGLGILFALSSLGVTIENALRK